MIALKDRLLAALADAKNGGLSEDAMATILVGSDNNREVLVDACMQLMANGEIERHGEGTNEVPYSYHLPDGRVPRL